MVTSLENGTCPSLKCQSSSSAARCCEFPCEAVFVDVLYDSHVFVCVVRRIVVPSRFGIALIFLIVGCHMYRAD
jgi:hypothetical protein